MSNCFTKTEFSLVFTAIEKRTEEIAFQEMKLRLNCD